MPIIKLFEHPLAGGLPHVYEAENVAEWLLEHYGEIPKTQVQVFAGEPCADTDITRDIARLIASDAPVYTVLQAPGGSATKLVSAAFFGVGGLLLGPLTKLLQPKMPQMPEIAAINQTQRSPNNQLSSRSNQARILQRIEDIYGTVRAIPSLMMQSYIKYIGNTQYEYSYMCVGRGYYEVADLRDGNTLLSNIDGARAAIYDPFTSPNSGHAPKGQIGDPIEDDVLTVRRATEVDGITLPAFNQVQLAPNDSYTYIPASVSGEAGDTIIQGDGKPSFESILTPGDYITITMASFVVGGFSYNYSGTYEVLSVAGNKVVLDHEVWPVQADNHPSAIQKDNADERTSWVTLPDKERTQVWVNVRAVNGMFKDDGGGRLFTSVTYAVEFQRLDDDLNPIGGTQIVYDTLGGSTDDEKATTLEYATSFAGPCRVRAWRTTPFDYAFAGTVIDEIKLADVYAVSPVGKQHFGNVTTIHAVTKATQRALAARERQLNCRASRLLPIYNGSTFSGSFDAEGRHVSGTITKTIRFVDIVAAVSIDPKIGQRNLSTDIDMPQIYGVYQQIAAWGPEYGEFCYTLDTDNLSYEETITMIADAVFCQAYRQNGKIRFSFDRIQASPAALFTHRNKKPDSETISRKFAADAEYDGIEFVYMDEDTERNETIRLPLNLTATKYRKMQIPGIRNFAQAWRRVNREYAKLTRQRIAIETTVTADGRILLPGTRVEIVDNTRFKSFDGEVIGQSGLELTLSQPVQFSTGQHSIVLMRRDGSLQSITCTAGDAPDKVILQSLPSEPIKTTYDAEGIRTIYSFAADSARSAQAYLVQEVDIRDKNYVTISAINYSPDYYANDTSPLPNKNTIIY
jgi:hypothetical protein